MMMFSLASANNRLDVKQVTNNVYAIIGELGNRSAENLGNNATFGFVVTNDGVVLIDSGATYNGAKEIELAIASITTKPVVKVINTGGQDHRWLGNNYFKQKGAEIIASKNAVVDQKARVTDQFFRLGSLIDDKDIKITVPTYADQTFDTQYSFELGGTKFELHHAGQAHTPGDSFIWLPQHAVMFTGDIVYVERMLGVMDHSNSKSWVSVFEAMAEYNPKYIIPGHGHITNLAEAKRDTYQYLIDLRKAVSEFMDNGGSISEIRNVDQSKYMRLLNFETLSGRNAQQVFTELEWE